MPEAPNRWLRAGYLLAIGLVAVGLGVSMVDWLGGRRPAWTSVALPLLILTNSIVGLARGPFHSQRVRLWYSSASAVAAVVILIAIIRNLRV